MMTTGEKYTHNKNLTALGLNTDLWFSREPQGNSSPSALIMKIIRTRTGTRMRMTTTTISQL